MNANKTEQELFWENRYAAEYINKNSEFDNILGAKAWANILEKVKTDVHNYLECGCNVGRNIDQIKILVPDAIPSIIEISESAFNIVTKRHKFENSFRGSILESNFEHEYFDLVFTMGVLIHINPDQLLAHMERMYQYSKKYILMGEYFNRTPVSIDYQGEKDKLFKRDFGKMFIQNFNVRLVDHGFLWGHIYDKAGFDDITWWLFEKV